MTPHRRPPTPPNLGPDGRRLWRTLTGSFELEPHELELLAEACRCLDEIRLLDETITSEGVRVLGSAGQPRVHPAVSEVRQHRAAFTRLLAALELPEDAAVLTPAQVQARRAAQTRWNREKERRGAGHGA